MKNLKAVLTKFNFTVLVQAVLLALLALSPLLIPSFANAAPIDQLINTCPQGYRCNEGDIGGLFHTILNWALIISFMVAVIFLIYGGFRYITSGGNQDSATKGKDTVVHALIGIAIILFSFLIVQVAFRFLTSSGN